MPIDASQVFKLAGVMGQVADEVTATQVRAVRKVQVTVRKTSQQEIRKKIPLKAGWVRAAIVPVRPRNEPQMAFKVREKGIPVRIRGPNSIKDPWYKATKLKRGLIKAKVSKGRPEPVEGGFYHAHFAGTRVFRREGKGRYPLQRKFGPTIWKTFQERQVQRAMNNTWQNRLPVEMRRSEDQTLKKHGLI